MGSLKGVARIRQSLQARVALMAIALASLFAHATPQLDARCVDALSAVVKGGTEGSVFEVGRNLVDYVHSLPKQFLVDLTKLGRDQVFWDLGAGDGHAVEMYRMPHKDAVRELLNYEYRKEARFGLKRESARALRAVFAKPLHQRAKALGITYRLERHPPRLARLKILSGRFFEDIPESELGTFDLAVDFFGVFAYTPRPDLYLNKLMRQMRAGGVLYLHMGGAVGSVVNRANGERVTLSKWMSEIPGVRVELPLYSGMRITREVGVALKIPELVFESQDDGLPPVRVFREVVAR